MAFFKNNIPYYASNTVKLTSGASTSNLIPAGSLPFGTYMIAFTQLDQGTPYTGVSNCGQAYFTTSIVPSFVYPSVRQGNFYLPPSSAPSNQISLYLQDASIDFTNTTSVTQLIQYFIYKF